MPMTSTGREQCIRSPINWYMSFAWIMVPDKTGWSVTGSNCTEVARGHLGCSYKWWFISGFKYGTWAPNTEIDLDLEYPFHTWMLGWMVHILKQVVKRKPGDQHHLKTVHSLNQSSGQEDNPSSPCCTTKVKLSNTSIKTKGLRLPNWQKRESIKPVLDFPYSSKKEM